MGANKYLSRTFAKVSKRWRARLNKRLAATVKIANEVEADRQAARALAMGADPDCNANGDPILFHACSNGRAGMARLLIDAGADIEKKALLKQTPFMAAAGNGDAEIMRLLADAGANRKQRDASGYDALSYLLRGADKVDGKDTAKKQRFIEAYEFLKVQSGLSLNAEARKEIYLRRQNRAFLEPELEREIAFARAVKSGNITEAETLMKQGLDPDFAEKYGVNRALYDAIERSDEWMVWTLARGGADTRKHFAVKDVSPLMFAIECNRAKIIPTLAQYGADPTKPARLRDTNGRIVEVPLTDYARGSHPDLVAVVEKAIKDWHDYVPSVALRRPTTVKRPLRLNIRRSEP